MFSILPLISSEWLYEHRGRCCRLCGVSRCRSYRNERVRIRCFLLGGAGDNPLSTPTAGCTLNICPLKGSATQLSVISRNGFTIENLRTGMSSGLWLISLYDTLYEYCQPELKDVPLTFNLTVRLSNSDVYGNPPILSMLEWVISTELACASTETD